MSLENDPFDTQPAPVPAYFPEPAPEDTGGYLAPSEPRPRAAWRNPVWIGLGILGAAVLLIICILAALLLTQGGASTIQPTITPTPAGPLVVAQPDIVSGGSLVTLRGTNFRPNDRVIFYLRDPSQPSQPILQIGTTETSGTGSFAWSFTYPSVPPWTTIARASIIVQSTATGGYVTVGLTVANVLVPTVSGPTPLATVLPVTPPPVPPTWTPAPMPTLTQTPDPNQWRGEYYNNPNLQAPPSLVRNDPSINFDWGFGSPAPNIPVDYFSVRWTRSLSFEGGMYRFSARVDDGVRVWLDSQIIIDEWHTATPNTYIKDVNVTAGAHVVRVEYFEGVGAALINFNIDKITSYPDWKGEYFANQFLTEPPTYTRNDVAVSFDWGNNAPAPGIPADYFSARWTRSANFGGGNYRFTLRLSGGVNFYIDGSLIVSEWYSAANATYTRDFNLSPGTHNLRIEYFHTTGPANIWFTYQPSGGSSTDWSGNYFANDHWSGIPTMVRFDPEINFDWGTGSPGPLLPIDFFSVRWTRTLQLAAGQYQFDFTVDDGVRFYVDGQLVLDQVKESAVVNYALQLNLSQGNHEFRLEYVEYSGQAIMKFTMTPLSIFGTPTPTFVPTSTWTPVPPTSTATPLAATPTPGIPTITSFTAAPQTVTVGAQCVTLNWSTAGAVSPIALEVNGQTLQTNLPAAGQAQHCPTESGQKVYTLIITSSPYYAPQTATQIVQAVAAATPTVSVQPF
jgi:hypothetical protein